MGMEAFQLFDFLGPALVGGSIAVIYLWLIAPRMIPERQPPMATTVARLFTAQIRINENSAIVGKTLAEAILKTEDALKVDTIQRGRGAFINPLPDVVLRANDRLTTSDTQQNLPRIRTGTGWQAVFG